MTSKNIILRFEVFDIDHVFVTSFNVQAVKNDFQKDMINQFLHPVFCFRHHNSKFYKI